MKDTNQAEQIAGEQQFADGLTQNAPRIGSFVIAGKPVAPADAAQVALARVAAIKAVLKVRGDYRAAVAAMNAELSGSQPFMTAVRRALRLMLSNDVALLAALGLAPDRQPVVAPETLVAAAAKARATRAARGTRGKKQLAAIRGDVAGVTVTPIVTSTAAAPAATAPATTAAPAPAAATRPA